MSLQRIPDKIDSKFRYVLLAATRAEQLMRGANAKLDIPAKQTRIAMEEVMQEIIRWEYGPEPDREAPVEAVIGDPES